MDKKLAEKQKIAEILNNVAILNNDLKAIYAKQMQDNIKQIFLDIINSKKSRAEELEKKKAFLKERETLLR